MRQRFCDTLKYEKGFPLGVQMEFRHNTVIRHTFWPLNCVRQSQQLSRVPSSDFSPLQWILCPPIIYASYHANTQNTLSKYKICYRIGSRWLFCGYTPPQLGSTVVPTNLNKLTVSFFYTITLIKLLNLLYEGIVHSSGKIRFQSIVVPLCTGTVQKVVFPHFLGSKQSTWVPNEQTKKRF